MARLLGTLRSSQPVARFQRSCGLFPAAEEGGGSSGDPAEGPRERGACNGAGALRCPARAPPGGVRSGLGPQVSAAGGPGCDSAEPPPALCAHGRVPRHPAACPAREEERGFGLRAGRAVRCRSPAASRPRRGGVIGWVLRALPSLTSPGWGGRCELELPAEGAGGHGSLGPGCGGKEPLCSAPVSPCGTHLPRCCAGPGPCSLHRGRALLPAPSGSSRLTAAQEPMDTGWAPRASRWPGRSRRFPAWSIIPCVSEGNREGYDATHAYRSDDLLFLVL